MATFSMWFHAKGKPDRHFPIPHLSRVSIYPNIRIPVILTYFKRPSAELKREKYGEEFQKGRNMDMTKGQNPEDKSGFLKFYRKQKWMLALRDKSACPVGTGMDSIPSITKWSMKEIS